MKSRGTSRVQDAVDFSRLANLRFTDDCRNCRYAREYRGAYATDVECIRLGRSMSCLPLCDSGGRICNYWRKRPQSYQWWTDKNPHWDDRYYKRATLEAWRERVAKRYLREQARMAERVRWCGR